VPTMTVTFLLSGKVTAAARDYFDRLRRGPDDPAAVAQKSTAEP
jgi:hypothetical protein